MEVQLWKESLLLCVGGRWLVGKPAGVDTVGLNIAESLLISWREKPMMSLVGDRVHS